MKTFHSDPDSQIQCPSCGRDMLAGQEVCPICRNQHGFIKSHVDSIACPSCKETNVVEYDWHVSPIFECKKCGRTWVMPSGDHERGSED